MALDRPLPQARRIVWSRPGEVARSCCMRRMHVHAHEPSKHCLLWYLIETGLSQKRKTQYNDLFLETVCTHAASLQELHTCPCSSMKSDRFHTPQRQGAFQRGAHQLWPVPLSVEPIIHSRHASKSWRTVSTRNVAGLNHSGEKVRLMATSHVPQVLAA